MLKPLQIEGARALAEAGKVDHVKVVACNEGLYVEINRQFTVSNRMKQTRVFAKADTCFSWLREMGISRVNDVDLSLWGAEGGTGISGLSGILAVWQSGVTAVTGGEWMRLFRRTGSLSNKGRHAEAIIAATQALDLPRTTWNPITPTLH